MSLTIPELRILATPPVSEVGDSVSPPSRAPSRRLIAYKPLKGTPACKLAIAPSSALFAGKLDPVRSALAKVERELGDVVAELRCLKLAPPPKGAIVMTAGPDAALTGLPGDLFLGYDAGNRKVMKHFDPLLIPRLPNLPSRLRAHETAFAEQFASDVRGTLKKYRELVGDSGVFSVDLAKQCYTPWGEGKRPASEAEKALRAEGNLALHQTAVAIAKLAFLQELDDLVERAALARKEKGPKNEQEPRVASWGGGSGAGKGREKKVLAVSMPDFKPGAIFDAAGEGECREFPALLAECKKRQIHIDFVYLHKLVRAAAVRVVERTAKSARMVDVLPLVCGHLRGAEVVRSFVGSSALAERQRAGMARVYGFLTGKQDLDPDPKGLKFPYDERLDQNGRLHVPTSDLSEAQAVLAVLVEIADARAKKKLSESAVRGALLGLAVVWPDYFDSLGLKLFVRDKKKAA